MSDTQEHDSAQDTTAEPMWHVPDLPTWLDSVDETKPWLIERVVPADSLVLLSGQQKLTRKTFLAFATAIVLASGRAFDGLRPIDERKRKVLIIEEEGARSETKARLRALCKGMGVNPSELGALAFSHRSLVQLDNEDWHDRLVDYCQIVKPDLVILDAMFALHSGDENSVKDMARVYTTMQHMRAAGQSSIMYLAHLGKNIKKSEDIDLQVRGSSSLVNLYDVHLAARRYSDEEDGVSLRMRFRGGPERNTIVHWDFANITGKSGDLALERAKFKLTEVVPEEELQTHCLDRTDPTREYSLAELRRAWGVSKLKFDDALRDLLADGWIERGSTPDTWRLKSRTEGEQTECEPEEDE